MNSISAVILVGGVGSRFSAINEPPKQLSKLNKNIILINIMNNFKKFGFNHFIFPLGSKKSFFIKFFNDQKNIKEHNFNIIKNGFKNHKLQPNKVNISYFDAGKNTKKFVRIKKSFNYTDNSDILVTYGDDLANVNLKNLIKKYNLTNKKKAIVTTYKKRSQYGHLKINNSNFIKTFEEKPVLKDPVNIGFYIFNKLIFNKNYKSKFELESDFLPKLIKTNTLKSYLHKGYFFSIDDKKDVLKAKKFFK